MSDEQRSLVRVRLRMPADQRRRWPRVDHPPHDRAHIAGWGRRRLARAALLWTAVAAAVYGIYAPPTAVIAGTPLVASRVLVLRDASGSMGGTEPLLAAQMRTALAAGIAVVREVETLGFGFSAAGDAQNAWHLLETALDGLDADAVYLFSDFDNQTPSLDDSDADGLARLRTRLARDGIRLYLSTVREPPDGGLAAVAAASGGGVIRAPAR